MPSLTAIRAERERRALEHARAEQDQSDIAVKARCASLAGFVREAWPLLHPATPYVHGWHIDFICAHLEAITFGKLLALGYPNRLLINVPPGCMKSLLVSVFWPAWEWGPCGKSAIQYIATSYREEFCKRDSRRTRTLIESEWFQSYWALKLVRAGETSFENETKGWREAMPFGSLTGGRADRVIIDDPHSVDTAESDADRARAAMRFRESVTTRLNDPATSAIVLIMQRLHQNDLSGVVAELKLGYVHIMLPMEFEPERACVTALGRDPRTHEGELLFPERFPRKVVDRDNRTMTAYAVAGQQQQRPSSREGNLFKRHWFEGRIVGAAPAGTTYVRHWDLAASKRKTAARTAGVKLGRGPDSRFYVASSIPTREEGNEVRKLIKATAEADGKSVMVSLPQDPGQAGKVQAQDLVAMLAGFIVHAAPETGDKYQRAEPFAAQCEGGNVYLVRGAWNEGYLDELCAFPSGALKDQVDASSGAFGRLIAQPAATPIVVPFVTGVARKIPGQ